MLLRFVSPFLQQCSRREVTAYVAAIGVGYYLQTQDQTAVFLLTEVDDSVGKMLRHVEPFQETTGSTVARLTSAGQAGTITNRLGLA